MNRVVLVLLLGACSRSEPSVRGKADAVRVGQPALARRCAAFADRVVACGFAASVQPPMSKEEQLAVRRAAYGACTKTTDDAAALHYYGDVDPTIACMEGKDCDGVRGCLIAPARGTPAN